MPQSASESNSAFPLIAVLATGGTVAGKATKPGSVAEYESGMICGEDLVHAVPGLSGIARLRCRQIAAIGSENMTSGVWLALATAVLEELCDPCIAGVVVLHGTDTMEETAVFLDLVTDGSKPVVLTGAMRPADAVSADGPANILAAVRVVGHGGAVGRGVLVVMNDTIHRAREVAKSDGMSLQAFGSLAGPEGRVVDGEVWYYRGTPGRGDVPVFAVDDGETLPGVEIIYGHAGQERTLADAALAAGAWGIVHAGVGMGTIHEAAWPALAAAAAGGVVVACSTRVGAGPVPLTEKMRRERFVSTGRLNPQKARAFLQVALTRSTSHREIQRWFDAYCRA